MSRILVEDDIYDKFIKDFTDKAKRIKLGQGLDYEAQMGPLISEEQRKKISKYVQDARIQGAKLLCGGKIPEGDNFKNGFFFEPTVLAEVSPKMSIFHEEVFGPVACITKFSTLDEVVELVNTSDFALASSIWTKAEILVKDLAKKINAGIIWINTYGMFYNEAPYGGFKQSGFGKELGREGFLEYTRLKNVIVDRTENAKPIINYWYGF